MMTTIQGWLEANSIRGVVPLFLPNEVKVTEWFYGPKWALYSAAKAVEGRNWC